MSVVWVAALGAWVQLLYVPMPLRARFKRALRYGAIGVGFGTIFGAATGAFFGAVRGALAYWKGDGALAAVSWLGIMVAGTVALLTVGLGVCGAVYGVTGDDLVDRLRSWRQSRPSAPSLFSGWRLALAVAVNCLVGAQTGLYYGAGGSLPAESIGAVVGLLYSLVCIATIVAAHWLTSGRVARRTP
jgi:hypothetical protein